MKFLLQFLPLGLLFFVECEYIIDVDEPTTTTPNTPTTTTEMNTKIIPPVHPDEVTFFHFTSKFFTQRYRLLNPNKTETFSHMFGKITYTPKISYAHVVIVDWKKPASYHFNVTVKTGEVVGTMMVDLVSKIYTSNDKPKEITFVGNSLGGQLVALAAKLFYKTTGKKISRIISLDPVGYPFNISAPDRRLTADDAENVVVVHTDAIVGVGNKPIGTIDFYLNGGTTQPGCLPVPPYNVHIRLPAAGEPFWCHHVRVNFYLVEAIRAPEHFLAKKCRDYESYKRGDCEDEVVSLGDLETTRRGTFWVDTTAEPPYYKRRIDTIQEQKHPMKS
ncbi:hypothetical protein WA026_018307 [Henosepilachna vigintioctopunctata]|uniref:Lipase domain-containing protein n=1 Tax=Henosepilachna vigintioctopunctata TaxID=420089 RepID=A0AAW1VF98_9CUCU